MGDVGPTELISIGEELIRKLKDPEADPAELLKVELLLGSSSSTTPAPQGKEHLGSTLTQASMLFNAHAIACNHSKQLHITPDKNLLSQKPKPERLPIETCINR
eukprot:s815_g4.t1